MPTLQNYNFVYSGFDNRNGPVDSAFPLQNRKQKIELALKHPKGIIVTRRASSLALGALIGVVALLSAGTNVAAAGRPNVILILADDLTGGATGFEGSAIVKTPHLDKLAGQSAYFARCYTPTPQDAPSRATILTGMYPHGHGVIGDGDANQPTTLNRRADTFTARLKRAGYACGIVGKWELTPGSPDKPGFGLTDFVATDGSDWQWKNCPIWVQGKKATADKYLTDWHGDRAIEFVEKFRDESFFLWLSLRAPGVPSEYPPGTDAMYPPDSVAGPKAAGTGTVTRPNSARTSEAVTAFPQKNKPGMLNEDRSKYYAAITRMDENIGRLLGKLDELELADKTIIVFATDSGLCIGDHDLYGKGPFFYEELVRGPLLIRQPTRPARRIDRVVSLVDLAPTFCEMAGLAAPMAMHGKSLLPTLNAPSANTHRDERFFEYEMQGGKQYAVRGIVTDRYKFIDYLKDQDIFFDLQDDPDETRNVAGHGKYAPLVKVMTSRIATWRWQSQDPTLSNR